MLEVSMETQRHCPHCHRVARRWCCSDAELAELRDVTDHAIRVLDAEIRGPLVIDDGGVVRETAKQVTAVLRAARRVA